MNPQKVSKTAVLLAFVLILSIVPLSAGAFEVASSLKLATKGSLGVGGDDDSTRPIVSYDGKKVVFASRATDLVTGLTTNGNKNIFLYDVATESIMLITEGASGDGGNGTSDHPSVSGDGSRITFSSYADDLFAGQLPGTGAEQVFLWDEATGIRQISFNTTGGQPDDECWRPDISEQGDRIAFQSYASDLVTPAVPGGVGDIYLWDETTGIQLISMGPGGAGGNAYARAPEIAGVGTRVVFASDATDYVSANTVGPSNYFLWDEVTGLRLITEGPNGVGLESGGNTDQASINYSGFRVVFPTNATDVIAATVNGNTQIYLWDEYNGTTTLLTVGASGQGGNDNSGGCSISDDGATVAVTSYATDLIDGLAVTTGTRNVFVYDTSYGTIELATKGGLGTGGNNQSYRATLSKGGEVVAFHSSATDLIEGITTTTDYNVFVNLRAITYHVTFDAQNGTAPLVVPVAKGSAVTIPSDPTKAGFVFNGWWTYPVGGSLYTAPGFADPVGGDFTLYAQWIPEKSVDPEPPQVPPTGDASLIGPFMTLAILGCAVIASVPIRLVRKH